MTPAIRAFLRAASDGDANLVRGLLAQGTPVDSANRAGQTALMLAVAFRRHDVVRVLIAGGANAEVQDELGLTAFDWANKDQAIIEQLNPSATIQPKQDEVVVAPPIKTDEVQTKTPPIPVISRTPEVHVQRSAGEPALKGLAAAILRDHKPRLEDRVQPIGSRTHSAPISEPVPEHPIVPPALEEHSQPDPPQLSTSDEVPRQTEPITLDEETVDKPLSQLTEETAAPRSSMRSRTRIFELSDGETSIPLSKVEVAVPDSPRRSYGFVWLVLVVVLAGAAFGAYRLAKVFFAREPAAPTQPDVAKTSSSPPPTAAVASRPVLSAELVGRQLYLPIPEYPTEGRGRSGRVRVEVQVSPKGAVLSAKAVDGDEVFRSSAEKAAKGSAFSPDKPAGKGKAIEGTITYEIAPLQSTTSAQTPEHKITAVAGGPILGAELNLVPPDYRTKTGDNGPRGEFTVVVRVNRAGKVTSWRPLNVDGRLRDSVIRAAKRSTFASDKLPGGGEVVGTITYIFN